MRVKFKYPRSIDGTHYAPGVYELPDAYADNWFFKALIATKDVELLDITAFKDEDSLLKEEEAIEIDDSEPEVLEEPSAVKTKKSKRRGRS